jgi:hypothetical protein
MISVEEGFQFFLQTPVYVLKCSHLVTTSMDGLVDAAMQRVVIKNTNAQ